MGGASRFFVLLSTPLPLPLLHHRCHSFLRLARHHHKLLPPSLSSLSLPSSSSPQRNRKLRYHSNSLSSFSPIRASQQFYSQASTIGDDYIGEFDSQGSLPSSNRNSWPEWSAFLENLSASGYFRHGDIGGEVEFLPVWDLSDDFVHAANASLAFARVRPKLLGLLSKRDIEVVVESGKPFLFRKGDDSMRKMKSFLGGSDNVLDTDRAQTDDLMRFILSLASTHKVSSESSLYNRDIIESSARKLLGEILKLGFGAMNSNFTGSVSQFPDSYGHVAKPLGQKIEMKRGDWICTRCNFMNFARNVKCLECEEARPKRQLTGGEWECPQCDFFNYGRNMVCLRCDCKRPGEISIGSTKTVSEYGNGNNTNKVDVDGRLAANEEKAQRWFRKISQLDSTSDMSKEIADEDFPEIMPLRKGVNRFVVSTRKTPLERRLASAQYRNLGNDGVPNNSRSLDDILGSTSISGSNNVNTGQNVGMNALVSGSSTSQHGLSKGTNSNHVPFVPLPPDMFAKKHDSSESDISIASSSHEWRGTVSQSNRSTEVRDSVKPTESPLSQTENNIDRAKDQAEKSERWFKRVSELHDVRDLASSISDEDFPEIMPMRKGENRFVVSKKKDRSLTSPAYKRQMAMEQTGNSNFVPFVPFPPNYFAKDKPTSEATDGTLVSDNVENNGRVKTVQQMDNQQICKGSLNLKGSVENFSQKETRTSYGEPTSQNFVNPQARSEDGLSIGQSTNQNTEEKQNSIRSSSSAPSEIENIRERWSGKSLEGSAVKEPDPLDMSEEAKAERWFRRVAQIKDISELSQIPDEDFPSIMPMRKGVNRFVVSKRKTPLERRLTSSQYRRNLPIVSSDPVKKDNDGN